MANILQITSSVLPKRVPEHRVFFKIAWSDDWIFQRGLWCDSMTLCTNPAVPKASLVWHHGFVQLPGELRLSIRYPAELLKAYIKIEIYAEFRTLTWVGTCEEITPHRGGVVLDPVTGDQVPVGRQQLTCYGLEFQLSRQFIRTSTYQKPNGAAGEVQRAIEFNRSDKEKQKGNQNDDDSNPMFCDDLSTAKFWSTRSIFKYLTLNNWLRNNLNHEPLDVAVDEAALDLLPDWDKPNYKSEGRSLKQMFDQLMDRRRLLGWRLWVNEVPLGNGEPAEIKIEPFTFAELGIGMGNGKQFKANLNQCELQFDTAAQLRTAITHESTLDFADQVIVRGARPVACFTISAKDNTLKKHWSPTQETDYESAASTAADYAALDVFEKQKRNKNAREADKLKRVYAYFGLDRTWDGLVGDGVDGPETNPYYPDLTSDEEFSDPQPFYFNDLRFQQQLPLKSDHDYTGDKIEKKTIVDNTPSGKRWEYLRPIALMRYDLAEDATLDPGTATPRYQHLDQMATCADVELAGDGDGRKWSGRVGVQDDAPGVIVNISGAPQHAIAKTDFTPLGGGVDEDVGNFDWRDNLILTVAMQVDAWAESKYPDDATILDSDQTRDVLRHTLIDLGDEFQFHYVAPNTVLGVDPKTGELQRTGEGGYIRDDRPTLASIARLAYQWYRQERRTLQIELEEIYDRLTPGDMIRKIGAGQVQEDVNSVVTSITWHFPSSQGGQPPGPAKTTIVTQAGELNPKDFVLG